MSGIFPPEKPRRVAVLGGGPTGLAAAYRLLQHPAPLRVDLYESSAKCGGIITTEYGDGFRYELGPATMALKHAAVADLIHEKLDLSTRLVSRSSHAKNIYFLKHGALIASPLSPIQFVRSALLSWRAKLAVLKEPFVPKLANAQEAQQETVDKFFERRFGREIVDYVVDPMLAGIFPAHLHDLSAKHALSRVWQWERKQGSVIGGMLRASKFSKDPLYRQYSNKELRQSINYDDGMQVLVQTLENGIRLGNGCGGKLYNWGKVRNLDRDPDGTWRVNGRGKYDAVISTIPAYALRNISSNVSSVERGFKRLATNIKYAPVSIVVLGFDKSQIPHPLDGFGALLPSKEGRRVLGVNFTSSNFPASLKNPDKVFLTVYIGGNRNPELTFRPAREVVQVATEETQSLFGTTGKPFYSRVKTWTSGIPVYGPGFDDSLEAITRIEKKAPGLVLAGTYRDGIGVPDALCSGINSALRVVNYVKTLP